MLILPQRDRQLVAALIDALDDDGYPDVVARGARRVVSRRARDRARGARDRAQLPAELRAGRRRRARARRVPGAAAQGAARRHAVPRARRSRWSTDISTLLATRDFTRAEAPAAERRREVRVDARPDPHAQSRARRGVCQDRGELCDSGRGRTQDTGPLGRVAQRGGHAQAAAQPHLRRHPDAQPRLVEPAARRAAAGSEVADPQRAAAVRDDPARSRRRSSTGSGTSSSTAKSRCGRWCCARSPTC